MTQSGLLDGGRDFRGSRSGQVDQVNEERTCEALGVDKILGGCSPGLKARQPP